MHLAPNLVKERRYHLRTYTCCFVANETLDWLIQENEVPSRQAGIFLMNVLQQNRIIHHGKQRRSSIDALIKNSRFIRSTEGLILVSFLPVYSLRWPSVQRSVFIFPLPARWQYLSAHTSIAIVLLRPETLWPVRTRYFLGVWRARP